MNGIELYLGLDVHKDSITRAIQLRVGFKTFSTWHGHQDGGVLIAKTRSHLRSQHPDNMARKLIA